MCKCKLSRQNILFEFYGIHNRALMVKIQEYTNKCTILKYNFFFTITTLVF